MLSAHTFSDVQISTLPFFFFLIYLGKNLFELGNTKSVWLGMLHQQDLGRNL